MLFWPLLCWLVQYCHLLICFPIHPTNKLGAVGIMRHWLHPQNIFMLSGKQSCSWLIGTQWIMAIKIITIIVIIYWVLSICQALYCFICSVIHFSKHEAWLCSPPPSLQMKIVSLGEVEGWPDSLLPGRWQRFLLLDPSTAAVQVESKGLASCRWRK